jgi:predicted nuclease of predicted toxin-antitoxin system
MILADENIDYSFIHALRSKGFEVLSIKEFHRGVSDQEIVVMSRNPPRIILTNDKDFGKWVFAHREKNVSVVFLRYLFQDRSAMIKIVIQLFEDYHVNLFGKFTTVSINKIRSTKLL